MKRPLLALVLCLAPSFAWAQCSGVFPPGTVCGNSTGASAPPKPTVLGSGFPITLPNGDVFIGSVSNIATPTPVGGDGTLSNSGTLIVSKTNGVAFAPSATTDATNASNISSGTLPAARLPNPSASTLGGIQSLAAVVHQWINTISTSGVPSATQPACGDLSNSAASCSTDATNATNISSGTLPTGRLPATGGGDVSCASGAGNCTIAANAVTNAKLAQMSANGLKGNNAGGAANVADLTPGQIGAILCSPQRSVFISGTNLTYTTPTCNSVTATRVEFDLQGGGAGGQGSGTSPGNGTAGNPTCLNSSGTACSSPLLQSGGGAAPPNTVGGLAAGGTTSGSLSCDVSIPGGQGGALSQQTNQTGGIGGGTFYGPTSPGGSSQPNGGATGATNTGAGGGGGGTLATGNSGGGGAGGARCLKMITSPAASYVYTIGATAANGTSGTSGAVGGSGAAGLLIATAYWQ